ASCSLIIWMICSSVNLVFICPSFGWADSTQNWRKFRGSGQLQGEADISLQGGASGSLNMSPCILLLNGEGFEVGLDRKTKVSAECEGRGTFTYPGRIDWVKVTPGAQSPGSMVNRAEELAQKDW
uniref:hypothetical protein n=1 Tax=Pseudophaeobacter profundi TaxID=3034152 RepID=UPI002430DE38